MPSEVSVVSALRGVHAEAATMQRDYVPLDGLRRIVGPHERRATPDVDGLELVLDSLLRGERGSTTTLRARGGRQYESLDAMTQPPRPGHTVTLTVSYVMQDICDRALADAASELGASGGDIVVLEPTRGEIRCLASRRESRQSTGAHGADRAVRARLHAQAVHRRPDGGRRTRAVRRSHRDLQRHRTSRVARRSRTSTRRVACRCLT